MTYQDVITKTIIYVHTLSFSPNRWRKWKGRHCLCVLLLHPLKLLIFVYYHFPTKSKTWFFSKMDQLQYINQNVSEEDDDDDVEEEQDPHGS